MKAGNTAQTLASTAVEDITTPKVEEVETPVAAPVTEKTQETYADERLAQIKADFAKSEAARGPAPSPAAPPTGPKPVEWTEPARGRKSSFAPAESVIEGQGTTSPVKTAAKSTSLYVPREEFDELLERIERFNNRSSQKI